MHGLVMLLTQLYARVSMLLTRGKQLHNPNISLREAVCAIRLTLHHQF